MGDAPPDSPPQFGWDTHRVPSALSGFKLEGYEILGELGRGGMGQVYRAVDLACDRPVAIKVVPALTLSQQAQERFGREAELLARLQHPNVVVAHRWGRSDQALYLVCELVEGEHLDHAARLLDLPGRLRLLEQVAAAVGALHAEGIVHRDLKPSNLLVDGEGRVKLIDFGVSTAADVERLTRTGQFVGTPLYAPPERFGAEGVTRAPTDDVWALGAIGYELLVGHRPYEQLGSVYQHVLRLKEQAQPAHLANPQVPAAISAVLARALQPEPAARYPHAQAFAEALAEAARRPEPRASLLWRGVVLAIATVLGAGLIAFLQRPRAPSVVPPTERAAVTASSTSPTRDPSWREALTAASNCLRGGEANDPQLVVELSRLRGALSPEEPEAVALANLVVGALSRKDCDWRTWGLPVLGELARSGTRPDDRASAEALCERVWWGTQQLGADRLEVDTFREVLVLLVTLDVDIDGASEAFSAGGGGPRLGLGDSPELRFVKLRAQVRKRRAPDRDPDRVALLELVREAELGPTTRARGLTESARSVRDPERRLALLGEALRLDPDSMHVLLEHARSLLWAGRLAEGRAALAEAWPLWLETHGRRLGSVFEVVWEADLCARALLLHGDVEEAIALVTELEARIENLPLLYRVLLERVERFRTGGEEIDAKDSVWVREGEGRGW